MAHQDQKKQRGDGERERESQHSRLPCVLALSFVPRGSGIIFSTKFGNQHLHPPASQAERERERERIYGCLRARARTCLDGIHQRTHTLTHVCVLFCRWGVHVKNSKWLGRGGVSRKCLHLWKWRVCARACAQQARSRISGRSRWDERGKPLLLRTHTHTHTHTGKNSGVWVGGWVVWPAYICTSHPRA